METLIVAILSLFFIGGMARLSHKFLPFKICPICAGVAGTWFWLLAAKFAGYEIDMTILAMFMGGSVVGIAYRIEKSLPDGRSPVLWKMLFIPVGFTAVYGILAGYWGILLAASVCMLVFVFSFLRRVGVKSAGDRKVIRELQEKMKQCC